jgi:hypothetical protein
MFLLVAARMNLRLGRFAKGNKVGWFISSSTFAELDTPSVIMQMDNN